MPGCTPHWGHTTGSTKVLSESAHHVGAVDWEDELARERVMGREKVLGQWNRAKLWAANPAHPGLGVVLLLDSRNQPDRVPHLVARKDDLGDVTDLAAVDLKAKTLIAYLRADWVASTLELIWSDVIQHTPWLFHPEGLHLHKERRAR